MSTTTTDMQTVGADKRTAWQKLSRANTFWITVVLAIEIVVMSTALPQGTFLSFFNLQNLAADSAVLLILATAATLVIITGGIDLSLGATLTLASVAAGQAIQLAGGEGLTAALAGIVTGVLTGALVGTINGVLIAVFGLPPFVVTLGSMGAGLGAARLLSGGVGISGVPPEVAFLGQGRFFGIPVPFLIAAAVVIVFVILLEATRYGERTFVIGSNDEAAKRGGINVRRHLLSIYVLAGALAGAAGLLDYARFEIASVTTGHTTELIAALAAVVIGGGSLFGGVGSLRGSAVGVFIPVILGNGLLIAGIERFWQDVIVGAILVLAVAFDTWRRRSQPR